MPAQVAAALSPRTFFTRSDAGFTEPNEANRWRGEAIKQLGSSRSAYARIAKNRAFRAGQKGSTFPWANTAAALYEHTGRCWLASEIAIIGAASPFLLGYTKRDGATAFGVASHPSELLAQTRVNVHNAAWWHQQIDTIEDELGRAEWALALWSIASGEVISTLLTTLERVLTEMPVPNKRIFMRAAEDISHYGWLGRRPMTGATDHPELAALKVIRNGPQVHDEGTSEPLDEPTPQRALLSVARSEQWLKVDSQPVYR